MVNKDSLASIAHKACTIVFALLLFLGLSWAYVAGFQLLDGQKVILLGIYGSLIIGHFFFQTIFAQFECYKMQNDILQCCSTKSVAITISAYQEDPSYLTQCLNSVKSIEYPIQKLRIIMVIDGNSKEDQYMMDIFKEIFYKEDIGTYVWEGNYHSRNFNRIIWNKEEDNSKKSQRDPVNLFYGEASIGNPERLEVESLIRTKRCVCIMQKRGGKREVLYTAFKAIGDSVDYIQVCDSDTKLDSQATGELVKVLDSNGSCGAVGGEVRILNVTDSFISFISSLHYWTVFNLERACQSYFNCVSCISGPLGMYRNNLIQQLLEPWYNQRFLGTRCTFGDDRHLTNRVLSLGYSTKYTPKAWCHTETPAQYLRWLNQQIRWTKSSVIDWFYSSLFWYKHSLWMTYEAMIVGILPFYISMTIIKLFYYGCLWDILWMLLCFHGLALIKAINASCLKGSLVMIYLSLFPTFYLGGLLPIKCFSLLTITKTSWGTSGRKERVKNYIPLFPVLVWAIILFVGLIETIFTENEGAWGHYMQSSEKDYVLYSSLTLFLFYTGLITIYHLWSWHRYRRNTAMYRVEV
ncbi:hyaluronan synthase 1-like [Pristis pectinata]|uniref:hyaluronan synthase 1-like n=1 Tax=Pristis pectinata TaxID=685728 RepID=UPI00223DB628|nr:hyaluronan synthase 1-like [Pristis pectinata]